MERSGGEGTTVLERSGCCEGRTMDHAASKVLCDRSIFEPRQPCDMDGATCGFLDRNSSVILLIDTQSGRCV